MKKLFYALAMTVAFAGCAVEQEYSRALIFGMRRRLSWDAWIPDTEPGHELSGPRDGKVARNHAGIDPHRASSYPEHRYPLFVSGKHPELALYKFQKQSGYARLHVDIFDNRTGEFVGSSATIIGRTYYDQYTVLFYFTWAATDLLAPP